MCISVKKFQQKKFDVSQKPLIQKMHTEPEILNWGLGGSIVCSDLHLCDSPASYHVWRGIDLTHQSETISDIRLHEKIL